MNNQNPGQGNNVQPNGQQGSGHPAWQEYLNDIPDALKPVVQQAFAKWDQNVQQRIQEVHNQYAPLKAYEPLAQNNIPLDYIGQALQFATELESDPKALVERMNTQLNLGYVAAEQPQRQQAQQQQVPNDPYNYDPFADNQQIPDITQHPLVQQMQNTLNQMQQRFDEQEQSRQAEEEVDKFYEYLDTLTANTPFAENDDAKTLIAAFMSQGMDGPTALSKVQSSFVGSLNNQVNDNLQQQTTTTDNGQQPESTGNPLQDTINNFINSRPQPGQTVGINDNNPQAQGQAPVVVGSEGGVGSGLSTPSINFASMKTDDINSLVAQAVAAGNDNS